MRFLIDKITCFFKGHARMKPSGRYVVYIERGNCLRCNKKLERMTLEKYDKMQLTGRKDG